MSLWLPHGREPSKHLDLLLGLLRSALTIQWIIVFNIPVFQWTENAGVTDADLRMKTANCIVETMGPEDWEAVKQIYAATPAAQERRRSYISLPQGHGAAGRSGLTTRQGKP